MLGKADAQAGGCLDGQIGNWTDACLDGRIGSPMYGWVDGCLDGRTLGWVAARMGLWASGRISARGWTDVWMDGWMLGWADAWVGGFLEDGFLDGQMLR